MKYLKYFESKSEVSLKQKLESIVDMADYLWLIDAADSLRGFYGKCSSLFTGCLDVNGGWSRGGLKPYEFNVDCLTSQLETSRYRREERLSTIEELYKLSQAKKFRYTKEDIEKILKPVTDFKIFGNSPVEKIEISQFYDWLSRPSFSVNVYIHEDELSYDKSQIKDLYRDFHEYASMDAKKKLKEIEKEFYRLKGLLVGELKKIDFSSHGLEIEDIHDSATFGDLNTFTLHLKEV